MKLVLLGTGGLIPTDQAQTACFLLPEVGVLLDAGTGLYRLNRYWQVPELEIYLSHAHGDHTSGIMYLFASYLADMINKAEGGANEQNIGGMVARSNDFLHATRIHATQEAIDFLSREYGAWELNWTLLAGQEPLPCGGTLTSFDLGHHDEVGFRLEWPGHSMAYVTDVAAEPGSPYLEKIRGVDLLLHDGYGPDRLYNLIDRTGHTTVSGAARVAAEAGVGRLVLVHRNPIDAWAVEEDVAAARAIFPNIELGRDLMEIEF